MKKFAVALAMAAAFVAAPAFADTMQNSYANTIVVSPAAGGAETLFHFNADGTFTGVAPGGSQMAGTFTIQGDQLCMNYPNGNQGCTTIQADKNVGDTWQQTGIDGSAINVELRAGR
jgi:opacity protein-like surface antigen